MIKNKRSIVLILFDIILINLAMFASYYLRFDGAIPIEYKTTYIQTVCIGTFVYIGVFIFFGLYKKLWQYASIGELLSVVYAVTVGTGIIVTIIYFSAPMRLAHTVAVLLWFLTIFLIGGSRFAWRILQENHVFNSPEPGSKSRVLIVGAGDAGVMVAREFKKRFFREGRPVGFIDDDSHKQRLEVHGIPVLGRCQDIPRIVNNHNIDQIILAIPSASGDAIREIVEICEQTSAELKIMPGVFDVLSGTVDTKKIRKVQVEDLLGREPVKVNLEEVSGYLTGETVVVTGAGGSIGSEICRQIIKFNPAKLVVVGQGENNIFDIEQELRSENPKLNIETEILDIKDQTKVNLVFSRHKPGVVFHAAAHKHVPLMEKNPEEALKNNIVGTRNLAEAADAVKVKTFVLISTDKAVNPTSIMGATKRVAEMIIQSIDKRSTTKFVAVRFGNVLGSRGSVIPTFKKQIEKGGPVTVTHPDMVRFFMTIPEAAQLVVQAGAIAKGGEIFILDMGRPVKIMDLAKDLIRLSGYKPGVDIPIRITGMRPGEKLYEELLTAEEGTSATKHQRIFVAKPNTIDEEKLEKLVYAIRENGSFFTREQVVAHLQYIVPEFRRQALKNAVGLQ
ncbi:nucleoside-diphosphate sugar epimerase/dehydratase [Desulfosporosinus sp. FKA]|uniref:polysaccharide biosynthesis protein n=1 Tax=Desulfosporosinus sp. FKA TaxID=1969834 RepID=UPI000B49CD71|nr:nucleoside-diphosphate sugar epimerase/dehydratase [Desulfosporosinus sp. FKA]